MATHIPEPLAEALRLGTRLDAEVEASSPERLAGVVIHPLRDDLDRQAELEGWRRSNAGRAYIVIWREYSREQSADGWDYDQWDVASATVEGIHSLERLLSDWSVPLDKLTYSWNSAIPE